MSDTKGFTQLRDAVNESMYFLLALSSRMESDPSIFHVKDEAMRAVFHNSIIDIVTTYREYDDFIETMIQETIAAEAAA
jgi:hypothetical protein